MQHPISNHLAILIGGLFGVYAFHSEALFWILGRAASLSLLLNLLCWLCFFKAIYHRLWILPMVVFFLLGIFTYESLWVFPLLLIIWYLLLPKANSSKGFARLPISIIWIFFIAYFPLRMYITGAWLGTYEANDVEHLNLMALVGKTLRLLMRSLMPPMQNTALFVCIFSVLALGLIGLVWMIVRRGVVNKLLQFFVIAWVISYIPYISLGVSVTGYESERYLYYPSLFLVALLVYAGSLLWQRQHKMLLLYISSLFVFHIIFFVKSALDFKQISSYSKAGMAAIINVPVTKRIVIKNLPIYSHGMPVFNYGLMNGIQWLSPNRDTLQVLIASRKKF